MTKRKIRNALGLLGCLGMLAFPGCEESIEPTQMPVNTTQLSQEHRKSHFYVYFSGGHMFNRESREVTAEVHPGATYDAVLTCSNDGDSDRIKVYADGNEILSYKTQENRLGGRGWYVDQIVPCKSFTTSSSQVVFRVDTRTDSWGTWPQELEVTERTNNITQ